MGGNAPITVIYDGTPQAKARARFGRGHAYTPQATVDYQTRSRLARESRQ